MNRASGRSLARAAKAVSISAMVLALKMRICTATALAAASTSRRLAEAIGGSAGLSRTATRLTVGTSSRRNSSRLAANSAEKTLTPVALPPGRARLATNPSPTGSAGTTNTIGIVAVARPAAVAAAGPIAAITLTRRRTRSAARFASRSGRFSAQRYSIARFSPQHSRSR